MSDVLPYNDKNMGELKFEFTDKNNSDDDLKFVSSVKNLLVLIKDFYGAEKSAVYWFNKLKNSFKLLALSEDDDWSNYQERFSLNEENISKDLFSIACAKRAFGIYDDISKFEKNELSCFKNASKVRSIIVNPLEINGNVLALILCESKSESFFGNPNLYTLEVFSESIISFIKYFILKEEYELREKEIQVLIEDREKEKSFINKEFGLYNNNYFRYRLECEIARCKVLNSDELILIYTCIDNVPDDESILIEMVKAYANDLRNELQGYDMIFYLDKNLLGIIIQTQYSEKVFIELEKIRKSVSTKIYNINGKEINFTVSICGKRYDDLDVTKEQYMNEVLNMIESAKKEEGNTVKL